MRWRSFTEAFQLLKLVQDQPRVVRLLHDLELLTADNDFKHISKVYPLRLV